MAEKLRKEKVKSSAFNTEQKVAFGIFFVISFFGVIFGFRSVGANIRRPIELQLAQNTGPAFLTSEELETREIERQKASDTDTDGLTDYEELQIYKTSPYLKDSDSDGFDDKTEIFSGNDPNCSKGNTCGSVAVLSDEAVVNEAIDVGEPPVLNIPGVDTSHIKTPEDAEEFFKNFGPDEVRAMLIAQGAPEEYLELISDEELMLLFSNSMVQVQQDEQYQGLVSELNGF